MYREKVELSPIEATAYWWINTLKDKTRKLVLYRTKDKNEISFANVFSDFTEREWRKVYLELINYITDDVSNYVPRGIVDLDAFNQDTEKGGHDRINRALAKITKQSIPDIRLADNGLKDSVIYTNIFGACVWYKSCGTTDLPLEYDADYILTGNEKKLDFANLLLATIAVINERNRDFDSVDLLKERFCDKYIEDNNAYENSGDVFGMFDNSFIDAYNNGLIYATWHDNTYRCAMRDFDRIKLKEYIEEAEKYADTILLEKKDSNDSNNKKLVRSDK